MLFVELLLAMLVLVHYYAFVEIQTNPNGQIDICLSFFGWSIQKFLKRTLSHDHLFGKHQM